MERLMGRVCGGDVEAAELQYGCLGGGGTLKRRSRLVPMHNLNIGPSTSDLIFAAAGCVPHLSPP
jgi:hypothetical protein